MAATFDRVIESNRILMQYKGMLQQQRDHHTSSVKAHSFVHAGADSGITDDMTESATHLQNTYDVKEDRELYTPSTAGIPSVTFASLDAYSSKKQAKNSAANNS